MSKVYLNIKVQPRARTRGIERISPEEYKVRVNAPPSRGQANKEVIEILASYFKVPSPCVKIVRGQKSRQKRVTLERDEHMSKLRVKTHRS